MDEKLSYEQLLRDGLNSLNVFVKKPSVFDDLCRVISEVSEAIEKVTECNASLELIPRTSGDLGYQLVFKSTVFPSINLVEYLLNKNYPIKSVDTNCALLSYKYYYDITELENHFEKMLSDCDSWLVRRVLEIRMLKKISN